MMHRNTVKNWLYCFSLMTFFLFVSAPSFADEKSDEDFRPEFCKYYDYDYNDTLIATDAMMKFGNEVVFESGNPNVPLVVKVSDVIAHKYETGPVRATFNSMNLKKKLMRLAIAGAVQAKRKYYHIFPELITQSSDQKLKSCLNKRKHLKDLAYFNYAYSEKGSKFQVHNTKNQQKIFLVDHLIAALEFKALSRKKEQLDQEVEDKIWEATSKRTKVAQHYYKGIYADSRQVIEGPIRSGYSKKYSELSYKMATLIRRYPLIFSLENNFSFIDWANYEFQLSSMAEHLIKHFDKNIAEFISTSFILNDDLSGEQVESYLQKFKRAHATYVSQYVDHLISNNNRFQNQLRNSLSSYISGMNGYMLHLCESDTSSKFDSSTTGFKIHHNPFFVAQALEENISATQYRHLFYIPTSSDRSPIDDTERSEYGSPVASKSIYSSSNPVASVIRDQVGYCELLSREPPSDPQRFTWKTIVGMIFGIGGGILFVFLSGGIGPLALVMIGAGSGLTGLDIYERHSAISQTLKGERVLSIAQWGDLQKLAHYEGLLIDTYVDAGIETLFVAAMLKGARYATKIAVDEGKSHDIKKLETLSRSRLSPGNVKTLYRRGRNNQYLLQRFDSETYISNFWNRYGHFKRLADISTDAADARRTRDIWMGRNGNSFPSYHLFNKTSETGKDTYTTVSTLANSPKSENFSEAFKIFDDKINKYERFRSDINGMIRRGHQDGIQATELEKWIKANSTKSGKIKNEIYDQADGSGFIEIDLTYIARKTGKDPLTGEIRKAGEKFTRKKRFGSIPLIQEGYLQRKIQFNATFAMNPWDELSRNSAIILRNDEQAIIQRELEYLIDRLSIISNKTEDQIALLNRAQTALDDLTLRAREDALTHLRNLEISYEKQLYFFSSPKSITKILDEGYPLSEAERKAILTSNFFSRSISTITDNRVINYIKKHKFIVGLVVLPTGVKGIINMVSEVMTYNHWDAGLSVWMAKLSAANRDFSRKYLYNGYTKAERDCAMNGGREFSFMLCYATLVDLELSVEKYMTIFDREWRYDELNEVKRRLAKYAYKINDLRNKVHSPDIFNTSYDILKNEYLLSGIRQILDYLEIAEFPDDAVSSMAAKIIFAPSDESFQQNLESFGEVYGTQYNLLLTDVYKRKEEIRSSIKNTGRIPRDIEHRINHKSALEAIRTIHGTATDLILRTFIEVTEKFEASINQ